LSSFHSADCFFRSGSTGYSSTQLVHVWAVVQWYYNLLIPVTISSCRCPWVMAQPPSKSIPHANQNSTRDSPVPVTTEVKFTRASSDD